MNRYRIQIRVGNGGWSWVTFRAVSPFDARDLAVAAYGNDRVMGYADSY